MKSKEVKTVNSKRLKEEWAFMSTDIRERRKRQGVEVEVGCQTHKARAEPPPGRKPKGARKSGPQPPQSKPRAPTDPRDKGGPSKPDNNALSRSSRGPGRFSGTSNRPSPRPSNIDAACRKGKPDTVEGETIDNDRK